MITRKGKDLFTQTFKFLFRVLILARTWGLTKLILFIPYEIYYLFKFKTHTLFSINNEELDLSIEEKISSTEYFPTPYYILSKIFSLIKNELYNSTFIDFGSGAGRVLTFVYYFKPKKIIGIEFSKQLCKISEKNLTAFFQKKYIDWELIQKNAVNYHIPSNANIFFFYDPFEEIIMSKIIKNIKLSLKENKRPIWIVYISPRAKNLFLNNGFKLIHSQFNKFNKGYIIFKYN